MASLGVADSKARIDSGNIDGAVIGATAPAAGTFTNLTATGNVALGDASTDTVGFYGTTPIAQRTSGAQAALTTTATVASGVYGFTTTTLFSAHVAQLEEIRATLVALGLMKGS